MEETKKMEQKVREQEAGEQEEKEAEFEVEEKSTDDLADWIEEQGIQLRY